MKNKDMELQKYDGNIHPDEWINDLQTYFNIKNLLVNLINIARSLVDPSISLPNEIHDLESFRNALKEDITFTIFKNTNRRMLQSLNYIPEREGGKTSKFISKFRKLCYNAEINDIEEQKKYLYGTLPTNCFDYFSIEFYKKMKNVNSTVELFKEFESIILEESNLIKNGSIVALKHLASRKYLSSIKNLCYKTGSMTQLVFVKSPGPDPNSLWRIEFDKNLLLMTMLAENLMNCNDINNESHHRYLNWKFNHSKLENHQGYLKSGDTINLYIEKNKFLRSHDVQFTIGNDTFQEVFCHEERLGGNDEWCIELIK
ncbi:hypothetical protein C1645_840045 [Glomus cerebriforme]|uniref:MIR domain-containing protein n=1 Tax=Glomus cerebriforme TaxID=658196 RepID=A0A397S5X8_9GLOM|nr:hypothetical protein C1645_840045 [Glomus cerebriforme]